MNAKLYELKCDIAFTLTTLKASDSPQDPFIERQMNVVDQFHQAYEKLNKDQLMITNEQRKARERIKITIAEAIDLLKELSFRLKMDHRSHYKYYFPKSYTKMTRSRNALIRGYDWILSELNQETVKSIAAFKEPVQVINDQLLAETNDMIDVKTDQALLNNERETLYENWIREYRRLKMVVKAVLFGSETDYRFFFEKKRSRKRSSLQQEVKEEILETPTT